MSRRAGPVQPAREAFSQARRDLPRLATDSRVSSATCLASSRARISVLSDHWIRIHKEDESGPKEPTKVPSAEAARP